MSWNIAGQWIESCSRNMLCPCWFGMKELAVQDQGWCATADVFRIQQGSSARHIQRSRPPCRFEHDRRMPCDLELQQRKG